MSTFQVSAPTKEQLKHDAWLVITAFIATFLTAWQIQPDKYSKAGLIAAATAAVAGVLTVVKSILTTV